MKSIKIVAIAIAICIMVSCAFAMPVKAEDEVIEISAVIVNFNYDEDSVDCLDEEGNIWTFYEIEDWAIGDRVALTIWTPTNEILDVNYLGWWHFYKVNSYMIEVCD